MRARYVVKACIGTLDNVDHNPSSTSAEGSFYGTGISIIQTPEFENEGEDHILPFEIVSPDKNIELPDNFTVVKAVSINQKSIEVPLKPVQKKKAQCKW